MVGRATFAACSWMLEQEYPKEKVRKFYLESNLATDKKASQVNVMKTRGKRVVAEATIPRDVLVQNMRVEPEQIHYHAQVANVGAFLSGANNNGAHSPNGITAMFIATGQDVANVSESSAGIAYTEVTPQGDLYMSLTIPSLIVATYGGGTGLPTQRECLELLGCGPGTVEAGGSCRRGARRRIWLLGVCRSTGCRATEIRPQPLSGGAQRPDERGSRPGPARPARVGDFFSSAQAARLVGATSPQKRPRLIFGNIRAGPYASAAPALLRPRARDRRGDRPVRRPRAARPAVPGPAPAPARDPRADLHQARPGVVAARGHPAAGDHGGAQEPARPAARGAPRPGQGDRRARPETAGVSMFSWIDPNPLGSASIGQVHRARTVDGDNVVLKIVKPGNREILRRDTILLNLLGRFLQTFLERFQPRKVLKEFTEYTLRELDLRREADNAETFAANFRDTPEIVFPKIYREFSAATP
jgi:hypothetical protein